MTLRDRRSQRRVRATAGCAGRIARELLWLGGAAIGLLAHGALADGAPQPASPSEASPVPSWWDGVTFSGWLEGGVTGNPDSPGNGINFGQLYTDRANLPLLNELDATITRAPDSKSSGYDWGFALQLFYGTDIRYGHFFNEFDRSINSRYQFGIIESDLLVHLPWFSDAGVDVKLGQFPAYLGYEQQAPAGNPLYTHSYIFNYGDPVGFTGLYAIEHVSPVLDLYLGADLGDLSTIGAKGDNNSAFALAAGFGLNLMDGKLTLVALTHIGPEHPADLGIPHVNSTMRYFNAITVTWKVSDRLTLALDTNLLRDDFRGGVEAYGAAEYLSYVLDENLTLQVRAEVYRDNNAFFVLGAPGNFDLTDFYRGLLNPSGGQDTAYNDGPATYFEATFGVNFAPAVPDIIKGTMIRPEIRVDHSAGAKPFDDLTRSYQVTIATDIVIPF